MRATKGMLGGAIAFPYVVLGFDISYYILQYFLTIYLDNITFIDYNNIKHTFARLSLDGGLMWTLNKEVN